MRAVDTNVLVRLIARDDAKQAAAADKFVEKGAWVSILALAETLWVLDACTHAARPLAPERSRCCFATST